MNPSLPSVTSRFQLFIVNTGWHSAANEVLEENLENFRALLGDIPVYALSKEQSRQVLISDPDRVGTDPCLLLIDQKASGGQGNSGYHGFRLSLGRASSKSEAIEIFQTFTRFIVSHLDSTDIERQVRKRLHREGFNNVFDILKSAV